jgi:PKD repeat protein
MKTTLLLFFQLIIINISLTQNIMWEYTHSSSGVSQLITTDQDNNIFTFGQYGTITKLSSTGNFLFSIADTFQFFNSAEILVDNNNDVITLGDDGEMIVRKYDVLGNYIWGLKINTGNIENVAKSMDIDANNNIYITGYDGGQFQGSFYTAKISSNGVILWEADHIGPYLPQQHTGVDIIVKDSNTIYSVGYEYVNSSTPDALLIKYDYSGNILWHQSFSYHVWQSLAQMSRDNGKKVELDPNGNIYILSYSSLNRKSVVMKYDTAGTNIWTTEINPNVESYYEELIVDSSGVYVGGSTKQTFIYPDRVSAAKLDFNGNLLWETSDTLKTITGKYMVKHGDGIIVSGFSYYNQFETNFMTIRFDSNGNIDWEHELTVPSASGTSDEEPFGIALDNLGAIYVTGHADGTFYKGHTFKLFDCVSLAPTTNIVANNIWANISGGTYRWIDCNTNTIIPGATLQSYSPTLSGDYAVEITINGCTDTSSCISYCNINSNYTYVNNSNGNYSFSNSSTGNFNQSHWAFGDGNTSAATSPNHTFSANGIFVVALTVNDSLYGGSCFNYVIDTIVVTGVPSPVQCAAGFVMYPDSAGNITVVNSSTGSNLTYFWDFGDGNTSTLQNPSHTYTTNGPFYLCLTVDDGAGCNNMYCDSIGENGVVFKQAGFTINIISPFGVGIENETTLKSANNIYPNPTSSQLTIKTELEINEINIIEITGKVIKTIKQNTTSLNVADLPSGIYFIKLITNNNTITKKFVKQ